MNSKIFILLVIGLQLIDASIIKKQDTFIIIDETRNPEWPEWVIKSFRYRERLNFNISKTIQVEDLITNEIMCQNKDGLCEKYGYSLIQCVNKAYLKEDKPDLECNYDGNKFSNVNIYKTVNLRCSFDYTISEYVLVPKQCFIDYFFEKNTGFNPGDDKQN